MREDRFVVVAPSHEGKLVITTWQGDDSMRLPDQDVYLPTPIAVTLEKATEAMREAQEKWPAVQYSIAELVIKA